VNLRKDHLHASHLTDVNYAAEGWAEHQTE